MVGYDIAGEGEDACSGYFGEGVVPALLSDEMSLGFFEVAVVGVEGDDVAVFVRELHGEEFGPEGHLNINNQLIEFIF